MSKKVLIVNKFYYNRGGAEVVAIAMCEALRAKGYSVAIFTMDYDDNFSDDNCYVAPKVSFQGTFAEKLQFAKRTLGGSGVKKAFRNALEEFKPDVVHFHNIHSYLSPVIVKLAKEFGCRVVWTLHDYKLLCPSYACLRNDAPCELCFEDKSNVVKMRCMKKSLAPSILAYVEAKIWNRDWIQQYVDAFVCPSTFIANKMLQGGFDKSKLHVICNFVDPAKYKILNGMTQRAREDVYLYVGRLSQEKGIRTLLEVAKQLSYKLIVAGGGPLLSELKSKYESYNQICFLGVQTAEEVSHLLSSARFTVVPSECYENNPLSLIESLCAGTPVVGARIGGIPELIGDESGYVYESGNKEELLVAINKAFTTQWDNEGLAKTALHRFSADQHVALLGELYK